MRRGSDGGRPRAGWIRDTSTEGEDEDDREAEVEVDVDVDVDIVFSLSYRSKYNS